MATRIPIDRGAVADFCRRHHVRKLSLFGSVLRQDFGPDSDVDVLVEFDPDHVPGFIALHDLEEELSDLLGGRRRDRGVAVRRTLALVARGVKNGDLSEEAGDRLVDDLLRAGGRFPFGAGEFIGWAREKGLL